MSETEEMQADQHNDGDSGMASPETASVDPTTQQMLDGAKILRDALKQEEEDIARLRAKQEVRLKRREVEMERLAEMRRAEEARRKEEEAEKKRIKDEERERKRLEKEKAQREKEERAKKRGVKNFKINKSQTSSLDQYAKEQEEKDMAGGKTKEQLEEEKRAALAQRIEPLDVSKLDQKALIAKAKELHDKLYKLESDKYDLDDRFKRQQYDMMELAERARQMNKGGRKRTAVKVEDEPAGPCPFDRIAEKYTNVPPRVVVASKYERNLDRRNFFEKMGAFEKEWLGSDSGIEA